MSDALRQIEQRNQRIVALWRAGKTSIPKIAGALKTDFPEITQRAVKRVIHAVREDGEPAAWSPPAPKPEPTANHMPIYEPDAAETPTLGKMMAGAADARFAALMNGRRFEDVRFRSANTGAQPKPLPRPDGHVSGVGSAARMCAE